MRPSNALSLWTFLSGILTFLFASYGCHAPEGSLRAAVVQSHSAAPSPRPIPLFASVAEAAGLRYRWQIPGQRPLNILQTIGNGCAFLDYDNDGNLDILLIGDPLALYKGDGKGHFTDVTHEVGLDRLQGHFLGCAVGDYDNDGWDDIYISGYRSGLLLHNEAGKSFRDVTVESGLKPQPWGTSCAWADVDGDGKLDLYVGNYVRFGPDTIPQICNQQGIPTACGPRMYAGIPGVLYHNLGGGKFQDVTHAWNADKTPGYALGVAFADYDGSGKQSLAIANDESPGDLLAKQGVAFKNEGEMSGTALDANGEVHGGMGIDWGDYDNDGRLDLFVATFQHQSKCVYHNEGRYFTEKSAALNLASAAPYVTFGVKWLDYDNDGWLDLILANGHVQDNISTIDRSTTYRQPSLLLHNAAGAHFEDVSSQLDPQAAQPIVGRGLAIGDYDNDGRVDVLIVDSEGTPQLLHNQCSAPGHWLELKLIGAKSNRDGLGALVTVEAGGIKQLRLCQTGGSYLSASDKRVHVGLSSATTADIEVHWPSGHVDTYRDLPVDQRLTVREGSNAPDLSRPEK